MKKEYIYNDDDREFLVLMEAEKLNDKHMCWLIITKKRFTK